jgi:putative transposase
MARPLRIQFPGAFYHITSRGNERKDIFKNNTDRKKFLSYLESAVLRYLAVIHVYCLMTNHYHLLLETPSGNLSQIMQHVNGAYTTYCNTKRKRAGHLFQGRYKAILVDADTYAKELSRYIHLNPVRAGIVKMPVEYQWSSYRSYTGGVIAPQWLYRDFILGYFGGVTTESQVRYHSFVSSMLNQKHINPIDEVVASTFLGGKDFIEKIKKSYLKGKKKDRDLPALNKCLDKPDVETIAKAVEDQIGACKTLSKQLSLYLCHRYSGKKLGEIGNYFGIGDSGVTQASRRFLVKLNNDKNLHEIVEHITAKINLSRV